MNAHKTIRQRNSFKYSIRSLNKFCFPLLLYFNYINTFESIRNVDVLTKWKKGDAVLKLNYGKLSYGRKSLKKTFLFNYNCIIRLT